MNLDFKKMFISLLLVGLIFSFFAYTGRAAPSLPELNIYPEEVNNGERLLEEMANSRFVLLGEASHGTEEYYRWRRIISKNLVQENEVGYIAVEGDWGALQRLNEYVKGRIEADSASEITEQFERWPTWMWSNRQVNKLADWLKKYNEEREPKNRVGIYGFDIYGTEDTLDWFKENFEDPTPPVQEAVDCFAAVGGEGRRYAQQHQFTGYSCADEIEAMYSELKKKTHSSREKFLAHQHASVLKHAEEFYRRQGERGPEGWNARVRHMKNTVSRLNRFHDEKIGIGWAHNTHMGDARATAMQYQGRENMGQLLRENYPEDVYILGFGTARGEVKAGRQWEAEGEIMQIPEPAANSVEKYLDGVEVEDPYLIFTKDLPAGHRLRETLGHRAIGVVYDPAQDSRNFVPTVLSERYDAFIFFRQTESIQ